MANSEIRVLVVEDSDNFRRLFSLELQKRTDVRSIREVGDGLQAVQQAEQLQPELILLDIGLPGLNGIEAARRIRKLSPQSKILFVSQESSVDVVQEALTVGAQGYVVKSDAWRELAVAVNAVLEGKNFISRKVAGPDFGVDTDSESPDLFCNRKIDSPAPIDSPAATVLQEAKSASCHGLKFYPDDGGFVEDFTQLMTANLEADNTVMVLATDWFRARFLERLEAGGVDVAAAIERRRFIPLDVDVALSPSIVDGPPQLARFAKRASDLMAEAIEAHGGENLRIAAY